MLLDWIDHTLSNEVSVDSVQRALKTHAPSSDDVLLKEAANRLQAYLLATPGAVRFLLALAAEPKARRLGLDRALRYSLGSALVYLFDEGDLLPEDRFGILGLLDDAYLIHALCRRAGPLALGLGFDHTDYLSPEEETVTLVRSLMPRGVAEVLDSTADQMMSVSMALFTHAPTEVEIETVETELRVAAALKDLSAD